MKHTLSNFNPCILFPLKYIYLDCIWPRLFLDSKSTVQCSIRWSQFTVTEVSWTWALFENQILSVWSFNHSSPSGCPEPGTLTLSVDSGPVVSTICRLFGLYALIMNHIYIFNIYIKDLFVNSKHCSAHKTLDVLEFSIQDFPLL